MTYRIAFGTDTESIEDPDQLVLLDMPDECRYMDTDELTDYIGSGRPYTEQLMVGLADVTDALAEALAAHGCVGPQVKWIIDDTVNRVVGEGVPL